MSGARTHKAIAAGAGGVAGLLVTQNQPDYVRGLVALSAALGGHAAAMFPDQLEPACHSWHRDVCHSVTFGGAVVWAAKAALSPAQAQLFADVARLRAVRESLPVDDSRRFWIGLEEAARCVMFGLALGAVVGYVSHLVADSASPRSIPLLSRKVV